MKLKFDVTAQEYTLLRDTLAEHLPAGVQVWVFGSRAKQNARFNSDIDLALEASGPLDTHVIARLKDAFTEAPLPYRVDLVDMASVSESFRERIRAQAVPFPMGEQTSVPKLRFPGFDAPLESEKLGNVAKFSKGKGISKDEIDPNGDLPCIRYGELYTIYDTVIDDPVSRTSVSAESLTLSQGGEVLVPASGEDAKDIATAVVVKRSGVALGGDLNIIRSENDGAFLASYLSGKKRMALAAMAQGNSVVHLYSTQLKTLEVHLPTLPEQRKIASFLGAVDTKIAQLTRKKSLLDEYKEGCLQQLLNQKIRFKDDEGRDFPAWVETPLGKIVSFAKGKGISKADIAEDGATPCIRYGEIYTVYREKIADVRSSTNLEPRELFLSQSGDVIIPASGEDPLDMARACCVEESGIALGGDINVLRGAPNGVFLAYYLNNAKRKEIASYAQGNSVVHLYASQMRNLSVALPHPDEQRKIADFLSALDRKIELVGQELEHAKTFKKGLLQQMFV